MEKADTYIFESTVKIFIAHRIFAVTQFAKSRIKILKYSQVLNVAYSLITTKDITNEGKRRSN